MKGQYRGAVISVGGMPVLVSTGLLIIRSVYTKKLIPLILGCLAMLESLCFLSESVRQIVMARTFGVFILGGRIFFMQMGLFILLPMVQMTCCAH